MALVCVGLNPALQRRVALNELRVGQVNRATGETSVGIGGKGQGAYVAASQLARNDGMGGSPPPRLVMLLGCGAEGDQLAELLLAARAGSGGTPNDPLWHRVASRCRICTTLVESSSGDATEVVEPSGAVAPGEWDALVATVGAEVAASGAFHACAISGTTPPGVPPDGYGQLLATACGKGTKVLIDSVVGVDGALAALAAVGSTVVVKLNARELLTLSGAEAPAGSESAVAADPGATARAAYAWARSRPAGAVSSVCWTDGPFPGGVVDVGSGRFWRIEQRPLHKPVISPIGAGDATAGATLHMWCKLEAAAAAACSEVDPGRLLADAFAFGMAVGAASCLTGSNAEFDINDVHMIREGTCVTSLPRIT